MEVGYKLVEGDTIAQFNRNVDHMVDVEVHTSHGRTEIDPVGDLKVIQVHEHEMHYAQLFKITTNK